MLSKPILLIHFGARLIFPDTNSKVPPLPIIYFTPSSFKNVLFSSMNHSCFGAPKPTKIISGLNDSIWLKQLFLKFSEKGYGS